MKLILALIGLLFQTGVSNAITGSTYGTMAEYDVDRDASTVKWTGYHLAKSYEHWGNISVKSGSLDIQDGKIVSGTIVMDMKSITCGDLTDAGKNEKLVNHLKSDEFFNAKKYSTAAIEIKESELSESGGTRINADITIRDITKEISFEAILDEETDSQYIFNAELMIERSAHEVLYGWTLENAMISGEFKLETKIVVNK